MSTEPGGPTPRASERRLEELRERGARDGRVGGDGVRAVGGPMPEAAADRPGYYGRPALKPPVWTWEIPTYFFVGGLAGASAVLACAARVGSGAADDPGMVRTALWIALIGAAVSGVLLVSDLGRPARFLAMLRVFKWRSPMSVGVWVLTGFGGMVATAVLGLELRDAGVGGAAASLLLAIGSWGGAILGCLVATYTGVLVGVTAVPAWNRHAALLPLHFGVAGLGSAAGTLQLLGHRLPPLWALGVLAAAAESCIGLAVELNRHGTADRALRTGRSALLLRASGILAGPVALALYLTGLASWAAVAFLLGALVSRFGWVEAGRASARDPEAALEA